VPNSIAIRSKTYYALNSRLAQCDDRQLLALLTKSKKQRGWGENQTIRIGRTKVFVKRVPVTQLEYDNPYSTRNLYRLPTYYNYGVGSAGFGIYRELLTHIKTTNWVLDGAIPYFPLMYHHRIVPYRSKGTASTPDWYEGYIKYWNGSKRIDEFMSNRFKAPYEALIFLEYIPHVLHNWLPRNLDKVRMAIRQMGKALAFLRRQGLIHFDCHYHNILTDGAQMYLTDFGLALDRCSPLNRRERDFFNRHLDYDCGEFLSGLGYYFMDKYHRLPEVRKTRFNRQLAIPDDISRGGLYEMLLANLEAVHANNALKLPPQYIRAVLQHRDIITLMHHFFSALTSNNRKNTKLDHAKLKRLLKAAKFP